MGRESNVKLWGIILAILLIFSLIKIINDRLKNNVSQEEQVQNDTITEYAKESETIINDEKIPVTYQETFGDTIKEFYDSCIHNLPEQAYELLSSETKLVLYPTYESFKSLYYDERFGENMQYSFQSWMTEGDVYTFKIKIFENLLATGKSNEEYSEDYVTLIPYGNEFRLNINNYIGREKIEKKAENDIFSITATVVDTYMDYQVYTLRVKNKTNEKVILDTRQNDNTTYVVDEKGRKYNSFLYENKEEDVIFEPNENKTIQVKFCDTYKTDVAEIEFNNIVKELEYINNPSIEGNTLTIKTK